MRFYIMFMFALFIAMASAAPRLKPRAACVAPKLWEASAMTYDYLANYYARGRMGYDATEKRIRFIEEGDVNSTRPFYDNLYLFEKRTHYKVDLKTKKCSKEDLNEEFQPIEVNANSTYLGEAIIGILDNPGTGVVLKSWGYKASDGGLHLQVFTEECLPVEHEYHKKDASGNYIHYEFKYYDITPGISDQYMFDIPKECL